MLLDIATKTYLKAGRDVELVDARLDVAGDASQIPSAHIGSDINDALLRLAIKLHRGVSLFNCRDVAEHYLLSADCREHYVPQVINARSEVLAQPHQNVVLIAVEWIGVQRGYAAIDARVDCVGDLGNIDAQDARLVPINPHPKLRQIVITAHLHIHCTRRRTHN